MADARRYGLTPQLDIEQILLEAQHRWLRPAEICEILRNYRKFHIAPESPNKPPSGSLFLFDRKVLRYFRKDGHNWRKKKDGKTVKEAHERLKAGSVDVLHCYYAHGEENENFQRRSYWMLEEDYMHIVLVHYLEVKGNKPSFSRTRDVDEIAQVANMESPVCSNSFTNHSQLPSQTTSAESPNSPHTSEYEDAESDNYQASSRYNSFLEMQQYGDGPVMDAHLLNPHVPVDSINNQCDIQGAKATEPKSDFYSVVQENITRVFDETGLGFTFSGSRTQFDLTSWDEVLEHYTTGFQTPSFYPAVASTPSSTVEDNLRLETSTLGELHTDDLGFKQVDVASAQDKSLWQLSSADIDPLVSSNVGLQNGASIEENVNAPSLITQASLDFSNIEGEGLKKYDSFSRWMNNELGEVDDSHMKSSSGVYWNTVESESVVEDSSMSNREHLDAYIVSPSLSQDQLFSIIDFTPNWAYSGMETKVLITGTFLKNKADVEKCQWSCMFGEIEVPAEILRDGTLRCHAPSHKSGRVHFYVTCSNRLACSEVREFEFRENDVQYMEASDSYGSNTNEMRLHIRLEKLLTLGPVDHLKAVPDSTKENLHLRNKISSLMMEADDEWSNLLKLTHEGFSPDSARDRLLEKLMKEKLHSWLLHKVAEDGKGPNVLDKEGQGVLHLAAALGYDWAIKPTITAGVSINFRDVRGWTALHWAANCGRERTVVALIASGAAPGALTDPTPEFPTGRTPADLASTNGHKGIAGFLAESSLTNHLSALTLKESKGIDVTEISGITDVEDVAEKSAIQVAEGDVQAGLSLKDSLSAVRNASLAAARIYQVFRVHSFHRKKVTEYGNDKCGISDERALSLISLKTAKPGQHDMPPHAAAIRIQNKFRGWKGRKEFLIIRQRIVKIQAHVRGYQVRKHYKKIIWSVLIVEKAILRWRRKGSGLRGFRSEGLLEGPAMQNQGTKEDDYDFLQEGRKQTEARLQKALARVRSMVQYPEARDQYRRLLNVVTELQESKAMQDRITNESEEAADGEFMIELEELWQDDTPMPTA
ncbi:calmodulin-binding transcription activator 3 isoform X2 [Elaeis guineensis]|uniref:Calmodulin-binding transcription activator 3 isoform X2 n=1 Tax=Elaeis guineensis var. tenera TaxID=51953 RepID=A0A8N4F1E0_ELAGV|nr:calmodulin-binding transcription activator 3 isoform X2 [Elaeis guineensis]